MRKLLLLHSIMNMDYEEFEMAAIEHSVKLTVGMIQAL